MSWGPLQPARIDFSDALAPAAPDFGDVYHARAGALAQAQHVFLGGNGLPGRWAGRARFVVLELGFGLGNNFLATWQAWRQDARRCGTLYYLAIEKHPPRRADLARALAPSALPALAGELVALWPPLTPDMHSLAFDGGRVRLLLALGDIAQVLPEWVAQVDAFYLDGFAPARNPAMWDAWRLRQLPRLAAPGATAATWSVAAALRQGLSAAGFVVDKAPGFADKREMTVARFAPRFQSPAPPGRQHQASARRVVVLGAGLAGAAVARALALQGLAVQVLERRPGPAAETSGNAGGLFHGIVHAGDGHHARWLRAAALHSERLLRPLIESSRIPGAINGLLRGEQHLDAAAMQALLARLALPPDYVQVQAHALPDGRPAWLYPGGGWVAPAALCAHWLAAPGIECRFNTEVRRLRRQGEGWQLLDASGAILAEADAVVLCNAADAVRLLNASAAWPAFAGAAGLVDDGGGTAAGAQPAAGASGPCGSISPSSPINLPHWPLRRSRGQVSLLPADLPGLPALPQPLADTGYALRLADGRLLCGSTSQPDDDDPGLRDADHAQNLATLQRLSGWAGDAAGLLASGRLQGRVGWRLQSDDRLPLLGALPDPAATPGARRLDQPRWVPRQPGLYVFTALGSRGISQAALGAELLAAWLSGAPLPAPAALLDALDVARFAVRAVRRER